MNEQSKISHKIAERKEKVYIHCSCAFVEFIFCNISEPKTILYTSYVCIGHNWKMNTTGTHIQKKTKRGHNWMQKNENENQAAPCNVSLLFAVQIMDNDFCRQLTNREKCRKSEDDGNIKRRSKLTWRGGGNENENTPLSGNEIFSGKYGKMW